MHKNKYYVHLNICEHLIYKFMWQLQRHKWQLIPTITFYLGKKKQTTQQQTLLSVLFQKKIQQNSASETNSK